MMQLAQAIRQIKQHTALRDHDLAELSGYDYSTVQRVASGQHDGVRRSLQLLEDILNSMGYTLAIVQIGQEIDTQPRRRAPKSLPLNTNPAPNYNLAKVGVEGSNPFARSRFPQKSIAFDGHAKPSQYACSQPPWHISDTQRGAQ